MCYREAEPNKDLHAMLIGEVHHNVVELWLCQVQLFPFKNLIFFFHFFSV